jgi:hypothetical protein
VGVLSRDEFDAIEFEAAGSGDHETAARRMIRLAETSMQTDTMPRSEAFVRAGEQWLLADDPAAAENGFRLAIADGGPAFSDPRVPLARALFLQGRSAEAQPLLDELKAEGPRDPRICDLVAELLVEIGDLSSALDWATAGVEHSLQRTPDGTGDGTGTGDTRNGDAASRASSEAGPAAPQVPGEAETELQLLLRLRYRIRNDLGLPEDRYDALLDEA